MKSTKQVWNLPLDKTRTLLRKHVTNRVCVRAASNSSIIHFNVTYRILQQVLKL